jgi:hypothetical protein
VASELLGASGREMIEVLIGGERDPARLAQLAKGRLRAKLDDLQWPETAGSPAGTRSCAGCTWTPATG